MNKNRVFAKISCIIQSIGLFQPLLAPAGTDPLLDNHGLSAVLHENRGGRGGVFEDVEAAEVGDFPDDDKEDEEGHDIGPPSPSADR